MDEVYAAAAEAGLFVESHCGLDIAYPPDDDRATPVRFRRVIERFPGLTLICTHMGGWRMWDEAQKHLLGTPVYMETSFSLAELGKQRAVDFIGRHGVQRVCMGSDWPWDRQGAQVQAVKDLGLSAQDTQAILYANAAKLLGL
jgi:predicted TIM-barrel fold metal-dependent hydrolase